MEKVESVPERTHSISCTATVTNVRTSLASVNWSSPIAQVKKSLCTMDSTLAQQWPMNHACFSCHRSSTALEKLRNHIPRLHFNGWGVMDAFIWPSDVTTECWMAYPNIEEENCTGRSGCSESHAHHVQPKWTCSWPLCANWYNYQWPILLHTLAG